LSDDVINYDPHLALFGGEDGLECYRLIASAINNYCHQNTKIFLEIGYNQHELVIDIMAKNNLKCSNYYRDYTGIIRCLEFMQC
ncbi:MAG: hypothetical protein AAF195_04335, partial [Pseudomonadota bacterium]